MSSIFGSLSSTAASLAAQRRGLEIAGQNIANVNTVGYSRRVMVLAERPPTVEGEAGRGVEVSQVHAVRDLFLEARLRVEQQHLSRDGVVADALSVLEAQLGTLGESLDGEVSAFFNAFASLTEDPAALTLRDAAVRESERLAATFRAMADRFAQSRQDADAGVRATVDEINRYAHDVATLNARIGDARGLDADALIDRRLVALRELSGLVDGVVTEADGVLTLTLATGQILVSGDYVSELTVADEPVTGMARVSSGAIDITEDLTLGRLGGWLQARDTQIPVYQGLLDEMAYGVMSAVNALHESGVDGQGDPGTALFVLPAAPAGAAAAMEVSAAVLADARKIVAGAPGSTNAIARSIAALRDEPVAGSATLAEAWGQLVYRIGAESGAAARVHEGRRQVIDQLQHLRDSTSGVSLDEEAASLMKYQRAYEANARYFTMVNEILDVLMGMVR